MIVSIIGTLLSFISVMQNITKKESLKEKVNGLKDACDQLDVIYGLLTESKNAHNEFQKYESAALTTLKRLIKKKNTITPNDFSEELKFVVSVTEQLIRTRSFNISDFNEPDENGNSLPVEITRNCIEVSRKYPIMVDNLSTFLLNYEQLKVLSGSNNFGNELDDVILKIENSVKEILNVADDVILNTAPILDFIHYRIKETLNQIA